MPLLIILLLLLTSSSSSSHANTTKHQSMDPFERDTLFSVMHSMSSDRDWASSYPDPCSPSSSSWPGLECKLFNHDNLMHITRLSFGSTPNPSCKPSATFPSSLLLLPHLQSLFIFNCFTSNKTRILIPTTSNPAPSLQQLTLKLNPSLVGPIPPQISSLSSLQVLTLSQNRILGKIPDSVSHLTSLVHLDLSYNLLSGQIPAQITKLNSLVDLDLSYNSLTGRIPASIGELRQLQKLDLSSNSLTGSIPESLGTSMSQLSFLALSSNKLTGELPASLPSLLSLQYLLMDNNPMFVSLPAALGRLERLQELRLANSGYSGPIPASFGRLSNLSTLCLENNRLTGEIPEGLGGLVRVYHMNLSRNLLNGVVPFGDGFIRRLGRNLDLSGNPGLCVDSDERFDGVKIGVGVCGRNVSGASLHQDLGGSSGDVKLNCDCSCLLLGFAASVFGLRHLLH